MESKAPDRQATLNPDFYVLLTGFEGQFLCAANSSYQHPLPPTPTRRFVREMAGQFVPQCGAGKSTYYSPGSTNPAT